ncbi:MAG: crossover junction endodeoxyribonuclease RuvC [Candidatus Aminicenantes bacterium]|nr:crossover junction endodeoxyribonuclease RuvC [Candidatus Aminicenantes bacterium]
MRVLGLDPSLRSTGFGVLDGEKGEYTLVRRGTIKPGRGLAMENRVNAIREGVERLILEHDPLEAAVENPFYSRNIRTALTLGQVRGAVMAAVASRGVPLFEYSALEIKKAVTGYGQAEKIQVAAMVRALLHMGEEPLEEDAADALAAAICHINIRAFRETVKESGS